VSLKNTISRFSIAILETWAGSHWRTVPALGFDNEEIAVPYFSQSGGQDAGKKKGNRGGRSG